VCEVPGTEDAAEDRGAEGAPVLLTAWRTAEPTPLRSSFSSTSAADAEEVTAMPTPRPNTAIQLNKKIPLELALVAEPMNSPAAMRTKPAAVATLAPTHCTSRAVGNAPRPDPRRARGGEGRTNGVGAQYALEVLGHCEEGPEHGEDHERRQYDAPRERLRFEQREVEQGLTALSR